MSATPPRTSREALIAEMLGDLDQILGRIEKIPELIGAVEGRIERSFDKPIGRVAGLTDKLIGVHLNVVNLMHVASKLLEATELRMEKSVEKVESRMQAAAEKVALALDASVLKAELAQAELTRLIAAQHVDIRALEAERARLRLEQDEFERLGLWDRIFYRPKKGNYSAHPAQRG